MSDYQQIKNIHELLQSLNVYNHLQNASNRRPWYEKNGGSRRLSEANYLRLKRLIDLVLGTILFFLVLPLIAVCAVAIKLDSPGPIFFIQNRTGKGGKQFKMFKLRTMVMNAAELKEKYKHLNVLAYPDFKIPNDPRITKVGKILRRYSLDELPQFLNVVLGDMSLVGPRPTSFSSSTYDLWHTARLAAKPGVTGLWQISGRCNIGFNDRIRLDIAYMRNRSIGLDLKILLRTFVSVINKEGAE